MERKLTIQRESKFTGSLLNWDVFLDGKRIGKMANGQKIVMMISQEQSHTLTFSHTKSVLMADIDPAVVTIPPWTTDCTVVCRPFVHIGYQNSISAYAVYQTIENPAVTQARKQKEKAQKQKAEMAKNKAMTIHTPAFNNFYEKLKAYMYHQFTDDFSGLQDMVKDPANTYHELIISVEMDEIIIKGGLKEKRYVYLAMPGVPRFIISKDQQEFMQLSLAADLAVMLEKNTSWDRTPAGTISLFNHYPDGRKEKMY